MQQILDKLDSLCRFWTLQTRYQEMGVPLTAQERADLLSLAQQITIRDDHADDTDDDGDTAITRAIPVKLTEGSGFLAGELIEVSAERVIVGASECLADGTRTVVYVADAVSGIEYAVPCVVAWSKNDGPFWMGLSIDGVPVRTQLSSAGMGRSSLGIGPNGPRMQA